MKDKVARIDIETARVDFHNQIATIKSKVNIIEATMNDHGSAIRELKRREIENHNNIGDIDKRVYELENTVRMLSKQNEVLASMGERMSSLESNLITLKREVHEATCEHKETNLHVEEGSKCYEYCNECGKVTREITYAEYYKSRAVALINELKELNEKFKIETGEDIEV